VRFSDLKLSEDAKEVAYQLDSYRQIYDEIDLKCYFEPTQVRVLKEELDLLITCPEDLVAWQKSVGYGCLVKMRHLEQSIINLLSFCDIYSSAILIRHHMELCGLLCLSLEMLTQGLKSGDFTKLNKFITKTQFGTSYYNNPKLRDGQLALGRIETVTVSEMIRSMDRFLQKDNDDFPEEMKNFHVHNYAFLCQFSHPSTDSSCFFVDTKRVELNELDYGHDIQFKWNPEFGETGTLTMLRALKQNLMIGLACYFILDSFSFLSDETITQDESKVEYAYFNILHRFNPGISKWE
jgi:hypothetical protein